MRRRTPLLLCTAAVALVATACSYQSREVLPVAPDEIQSSTLYSADGSLVYTFHAEENRKVIPLEEIPAHVRNAVIAIEDERFYRHNGVDLRGLLRAVRADAVAGRIEQGGSTITQQYVKQEILGDSSQTLERKLEDASLAVQLERRFSKDRILELYLNAIYFGNGAYGIEAAAHQYFGKTTQTLSLPEAALLAGLIQRPGATDPYDHPEEATARRNLVLERMAANAFAPVPDIEAAKASAVLLASPTIPAALQYPAAYFVEDVKQWILDDPSFGETPKDRRDLLFGGGLQIHTTVDLALQAEAERAAAEILPDPSGPAAALVSIEPTTGFVKAMVGGRNFFGPGTYDKLNLASQGGRSSGSSFKPFVLATAIEEGIDPFTKRLPGPACITIPMPEQEPWRPCNAEVASEGNPTIAEGTVGSVNTLYAQLMMEVGPQDGVDMAARLGVASPLEPNPAAVLGTNNVTAVDMAAAYGTFANRGVQVPPTLVTKITRADGTILYEHEHVQEKAISADTAAIVSNILTGAVERGTGKRAKLEGRQVAGKTGTAQDYTDAWFVGYTPELSTAVWVGFPEPGPGNKLVPMRPPATPIKVFGGTYPAQIWGRFMSVALTGRPAGAFPPVPITTTTRPPGSVIKVPPTTVATGPPTPVPRVLGRPEADATAALQAAGFVVETAPATGLAQSKGRVRAQSPGPGQMAPKGSVVTIEIVA